MDHLPTLSTVEMHTGGDPFRLIESGFPPPEGARLADKQAHCAAHLDHLRTAVMKEPRGHSNMWGGVLVEPDHPQADLAALFLNKDGYAPMCGMGLISLAKYAVDHGFVEPTVPETTVCIQIPAGLVWTRVEWDGTKTGATVIQTVPVFAEKFGQTVHVEGLGAVEVDIANGVSWFAIVRGEQLGLDINTAPFKQVTKLGMKLKAAVNQAFQPPPSDDPNLQEVLSVIITDGAPSRTGKTRAHMVYAKSQMSRSPGGSAVSAHVAAKVGKGELALGEWHAFESASTGSQFLGRAVSRVAEGGRDAVVVEIKGRGFYTGRATYTLDTEDDLREGFLL